MFERARRAVAQEIERERQSRPKVFEFERAFDGADESGRVAVEIYPIMLQIFGEGLDLGVEVFNIDEILTINKPELRTSEELVRRRSARLAAGITTTTANRIRQAAVRGGTNLEDIAKNIQDSGILNPKRATRIARTESIDLLNRGQEAAWEASGVVKQKEWYTALDERVCQWCGPLHGTTIPIGGRYFNQGQEYIGDEGGSLNMYQDIPTPGIHPSCRCTLLPVI